MKLNHLAIIAVALVNTAMAQSVFTATGLTGIVSGASTSVAATNSDPLYNNFGPTANNITGVTFGNGFSMTATGPDSGNYDNTFVIGGTISGSAVPAGTTLGISYDFGLAKNLFVSGSVNWSLLFSDSVNNPGLALGTSSLIATGVLSGNSASFTGAGTYTFVSGASAGATFRTFLEVTDFGALAIQPPAVDGTMFNTGFGGGGITIASAVPEPASYPALAGAGILGLAMWRKRRTA